MLKIYSLFKKIKLLFGGNFLEYITQQFKGILFEKLYFYALIFVFL